MVAIGGGAAGMVTCAGVGSVGGTALMIEKAFIGGDCLVSGCVPSKAFLKSANVAHKLRHGAENFGLEI
jgi:pyruvate/2-oxoglutarate dehydrogenase complex dihydrolipoamide dehydrogenase (E3) component